MAQFKLHTVVIYAVVYGLIFKLICAAPISTLTIGILMPGDGNMGYTQNGRAVQKAITDLKNQGILTSTTIKY